MPRKSRYVLVVDNLSSSTRSKDIRCAPGMGGGIVSACRCPEMHHGLIADCRVRTICFLGSDLPLIRFVDPEKPVSGARRRCLSRRRPFAWPGGRVEQGGWNSTQCGEAGHLSLLFSMHRSLTDYYRLCRAPQEGNGVLRCRPRH